MKFILLISVLCITVIFALVVVSLIIHYKPKPLPLLPVQHKNPELVPFILPQRQYYQQHSRQFQSQYKHLQGK